LGDNRQKFFLSEPALILYLAHAKSTPSYSVVAPGVTPTGGHRSPTGGLR